MKKRSGLLLLFVILLSLFFVNFASSSESSSSNYETDVILSEGGGNSSSSNYQLDIGSGIISGNSSSSSYSQTSGFFLITGEETAEIPAEGEEETGGTTSGGGGGAEGFSVDKTLIQMLIRPGESLRENITITNNKDSSIDFQINSTLSKFMVISEESFSLASEESKTIFIDFFAKTTELPEAYTGRITITGGSVSKVVNVILEIKERKPLFDVVVDVLTSKAPLGGNVRARFKVLNLGDLNNIDIVLYYAIKDYNDNIISFKEESIAIDKELNVIRKLNIPSDIPVGDYALYMKASYGNVTASSIESFSVVEKPVISLTFIFVIAAGLFVIVISTLFIILFKRLKPTGKKKKEKPKKVIPKVYVQEKQEPKKNSFFKKLKRKKYYENKSRLKKQLERKRKGDYRRRVKEERKRERKTLAMRHHSMRKKKTEHKKELRLKAKMQMELNKEYARKLRMQRKQEARIKRRLAWSRFFRKLRFKRKNAKKENEFYNRVVKRSKD